MLDGFDEISPKYKKTQICWSRVILICLTRAKNMNYVGTAPDISYFSMDPLRVEEK
jgi:hypothetical protein